MRNHALQASTVLLLLAKLQPILISTITPFRVRLLRLTDVKMVTLVLQSQSAPTNKAVPVVNGPPQARMALVPPRTVRMAKSASKV